MSDTTVQDTAGRRAALEAIGDMLAVLGVGAMDMLGILTRVEDAAPGRPPLRHVARKARSIAARLAEPTDAP